GAGRPHRRARAHGRGGDPPVRRGVVAPGAQRRRLSRRAPRSPLVRAAGLRDNPRHILRASSEPRTKPRLCRAMEAPVTQTLNRVKTYQQFINGSWVDAASGETIDVENPATGEVIAAVPSSGKADVDRAVDAAATAFESWSLTTPQTRSLALLKIADILDA